MIWRRDPVTTLFSALTMTIDSPFRRRFAIRLAARPRTRPVASTTVGFASSGKDTHPRPVGLRLEQFRDRERGPARGVDLRACFRRERESADRDRLGQGPVREELARHDDPLV